MEFVSFCYSDYFNDMILRFCWCLSFNRFDYGRRNRTAFRIQVEKGEVTHTKRKVRFEVIVKVKNICI